MCEGVGGYEGRGDRSGQYAPWNVENFDGQGGHHWHTGGSKAHRSGGTEVPPIVSNAVVQPGDGTPPVLTSTNLPAFSGGTQLKEWAPGIQIAAAITGLDPNLIGGVVWAESRGNPNDPSTNSDGTRDVGLMQISQERWERDVLPNLTPEERAAIVALTGKQPEELDMNNPGDNLIGGALELKQWIAQRGSVEDGLHYYVTGGDPSIGNPNYVSDVLEFAASLKAGETLRD